MRMALGLGGIARATDAPLRLRRLRRHPNRESVGRAEASPTSPARRMAARLDVDLARVRGSGPDGLILRSDVIAQAESARRVSVAAAGDCRSPPGAKVTRLRGPAAALTGYMEQSLTIPTATSFRTLSVDVLDARRKELNGAIKAAGRNERVSFTHLIAYALVRAAHELPVITSSFRRDDEGYRRARSSRAINLGLAVDTERKDGTRFLVVPVIKDADALDFAAFRARYEELVAKARDNKLGADDLQGASFTLTNPGGIGTVASVPRLMAGQGAILATGAIGYPSGFSERERAIAQAARRLEDHADDEHLRSSRHSRRAVGRVSAPRRRTAARQGWILRSDLRVARICRPRAMPQTRASPAGGRGNGAAVRRDAARGRGRHGDRLGVSALRAPRRASRSARRGTGRRLVARTADVRSDARAAKRDSRERAARESAGQHAGRRPAAAAKRRTARRSRTRSSTFRTPTQRVWLRDYIESGKNKIKQTPQRQIEFLERLTQVEAFDRYVRKTFLGQKTFSGEGLDVMVPMLEEMLDMLADDGVANAVLGMAHRGRLNVIAHVVNVPYEEVMTEFEAAQYRGELGDDDVMGDVKYHHGATGDVHDVEGQDDRRDARAQSESSRSGRSASSRAARARCRPITRTAFRRYDRRRAVPILIHGDAAFTGQGVVCRSLQPAVAARLRNRRHDSSDRQQSDRLYDRSGRRAVDAVRLRFGQRLRRADRARQCRRRRRVHRGGSLGSRFPACVRPRRADRSDRLSPVRSQRARRAGVYAAADGRAHQEPSDGARALREQARQSRRAHGRSVARDGRTGCAAARKKCAQVRSKASLATHIARAQDGRQQHVRRNRAPAGAARPNCSHGAMRSSACLNGFDNQQETARTVRAAQGDDRRAAASSIGARPRRSRSRRS